MLRLRGTRLLGVRCHEIHTSAPVNPRYIPPRFANPAPQPQPPKRLEPVERPQGDAAQRLAWRQANVPVDSGLLVKVASCLKEDDWRSALSTAHKHLNSLCDHNVPTEARAASYDAIISLFLRHKDGATASRSIFNRQLSEGVPFTSDSAFKAVRSLRGQVIQQLHLFIGLLPESFSPNLLAEIMRMFIQQARPSPDEVRRTISSVMTAYHKEQGLPLSETGGRPLWTWELRLVLLEAYIAHGDFRSTFKAIRVLKTAAEAQRQQDPNWPGNDGKVLTAAHTMVMGSWVRWAVKDTEHDRRTGSEIPCRLAHQLASILSPTGTPISLSNLPIPFLNAWMNAERVAWNKGNVESIWNLISGQSVDSTVAGIKPPKWISPDSWWVLFKYLKQRPPESYRPIVDLVLSKTVSNATLDIMLSTVAAAPTPDLELVLRITPFTPTARTVDLVASVLVRAARAGVIVDPNNPFENTSTSWNIEPPEWEWVERAVARTAALEAMSAASVEMQARIEAPMALQEAESTPAVNTNQETTIASTPTRRALDFQFPVSRSVRSFLPLEASPKGTPVHRVEYRPRPVEEYRELLWFLRKVLKRFIAVPVEAPVPETEGVGELGEGLWEEEVEEEIQAAVGELVGKKGMRNVKRWEAKGRIAESRVREVFARTAREERRAPANVRRRKVTAKEKEDGKDKDEDSNAGALESVKAAVEAAERERFAQARRERERAFANAISRRRLSRRR